MTAAPPSQDLPAGERLTPAVKSVPLRVEISADKLQATLSGQAAPGTSQAGLKDLLASLLREKEVRHGVLVPQMRQAIEELAKGHTLNRLLIARATLPQAGRDAEIKSLVELQNERVGRVTETGHIDFRDLGPLPVVEAGTPIATLSPALTGKPGVDVLGNLLPAKEPRRLLLRKGRGIELQKNGLLAVASAHGIVHRPEDDKFEVLEIFNVAGNVDFKTGHINFPGMVKISGAVLPDFKVKAGSMEVGELEPGCQVEVEHDLAVHGGVMGAEVSAGGKMSARFIRDSRVVCGGDVAVEAEIHQSHIESNGKVVVSAGDSRIVNSYVSAIKGVVAAVIKSSGHNATVIRIGLTAQSEAQLHNLRRKIDELEGEDAMLNEAMIAQRQGLQSADQELKNVITALKDPERQHHRAKLMEKVELIKGLREKLTSSIEEGCRRREEIIYDLQRLRDQLAQLELLSPEGSVWLDVRSLAEASTEIRGPRASLTLKSEEKSFSATEMADPNPRGTGKIIMSAQPLRKRVV